VAAHLGEVLPIAGKAPVGHGELTLVAAASSSLYDGRDATRSWLLETPDSLTQGTWEVPLELAADVARAGKIATGDRVRLALRWTGADVDRVRRRGPRVPDRGAAFSAAAVTAWRGEPVV